MGLVVLGIVPGQDVLDVVNELRGGRVPCEVVGAWAREGTLVE